MKYKFYLNDADVTAQVGLGASLKERFAEELDVGHVTLNYSEENEAKYVLGSFRIDELDDNDVVVKSTSMLIANDEVEPITKYPPYLYKHNFSLIELTHKLDYYIVNALTFVQPLEDTRGAPFISEFHLDYGGYLYGTGETEDLLAKNANTWSVDFPTEFPFKTRHTLPVTFDKIGESKVYILNTTASTPERYWAEDTSANSYWRADVYKVVYDYYGNETETLVEGDINYSLLPITIDDNNGSAYYRVKLEFKTTTQKSLDDPDDVIITRRYEFEFKAEQKKKYSIYDVIKRIRDVYPLEKKSRHAGTRLFEISTELENKLKQIQAPQLFLSKFTMREALNTVLKYVNGISRLIQNGGRVLTADFFNKRTTDYVFRYQDIFALSSEQSNADYASVNRTFMNNVVGSSGVDKPSVKEMGDDGYKGLRSEQMHLLFDTAELRLKYNIYRLLKITARVNLNFSYTYYKENIVQPSKAKHTVELDLDITPYIVEKSIYDLAEPQLSVFGEYGNLDTLIRPYYRSRKDDLAYYRYGDNSIFLGQPIGEYFQVTNLYRIIRSAVSEKLQYYQGKKFDEIEGLSAPRYFEDSRDNRGLEYRVEARGKESEDADGNEINFTDAVWTTSATNSTQEIALNVEYIALENGVQDAHKEDTSIIEKYSEAINHTNESIVNFERASVGNYGIAQRLGVPTIRYGKIGTDEEIEPVGAINQKREIVVEKQRDFYPDYVASALEASKDFNRLAKYIGIDRGYRPYEVPQGKQTLERKDIYTEYIEYSAHEGDAPRFSNNTFINGFSLSTILNTFLGDTSGQTKPITQALFRTDGFLENHPDYTDTILNIRNAILMPTISQGGKHTLSFGMHFKSNIEAGYSIVEHRPENWFSVEDYSILEPYGLWEKMVPYGDENGEFNEVHFTLLTNYDQSKTMTDRQDYFDATKKLPLVTSTDTSSNTYFIEQGFNKRVETGNGATMDDALIVMKDRGEIYGITYQISFVPKDNDALEEVVIGNEFFNDNYLVNGYIEKDLRFCEHETDDFYGTFGDYFEHESVSRRYVSEMCELYYKNGVVAGIKCNLTDTSPNMTHWSISTGDGKLLLGVNSPTKNVVLFEPRNKRTSIDYDW